MFNLFEIIMYIISTLSSTDFSDPERLHSSSRQSQIFNRNIAQSFYSVGPVGVLNMSSMCFILVYLAWKTFLLSTLL